MFSKEKVILKAAIKQSIQKMIQKESDDWPPKCGIILYQPQRPPKNNDNEEIKWRDLYSISSPECEPSPALVAVS